MLQLKPTEKIDEWLRGPLEGEPTDERVEVRRAHPHEFDRIYDLVDSAFGRMRPRDEFDWLYRRNPSGVARCFMVLDKQTGRLISGEANFPWPMAWGSDGLDAALVGDSTTAPGWQRQGLANQRMIVKSTDPWLARCLRFSGPNVLSQNAMVKYGRDDALMGAIPAAALIFRSRPQLRRLGGTRPVAALASPIVDAALATWRRIALSTGRRYSVRQVHRFDSSFDPLTEQYMYWPGFWSPHDSDFLNWRYLDHPTQEFQGLALESGGEPIAYCVIRYLEGASTLMEFVAPEGPIARSLLSAAVAAARENGADHLNFFAPPRWPHWPLLRRSGFIGYPSENYLSARGAGPACQRLENWQIVPGDRDYR